MRNQRSAKEKAIGAAAQLKVHMKDFTEVKTRVQKASVEAKRIEKKLAELRHEAEQATQRSTEVLNAKRGAEKHLSESETSVEKAHAEVSAAEAALSERKDEAVQAAEAFSNAEDIEKVEVHSAEQRVTAAKAAVSDQEKSLKTAEQEESDAETKKETAQNAHKVGQLSV